MNEQERLMLKKNYERMGQRTIPVADSKIIVNFANQLATGETELEIERIKNMVIIKDLAKN
jgi:hypothetical protein